MLGVIDFICTCIWKLFLLINYIIIEIFHGMALVFALIWKGLISCMPAPVSKVLGKIECFIQTILKYSVFAFFTFLHNLYKGMLEYFSNSKNFKRIFAVFIILLIAYMIYPPYSWGPWQPYEKGKASWYGPGFYWKNKADGSKYLPWDVTAAHKTLPLGTYVKVKNLDNGKSVFLKVDDRGPYVQGRVLDLSYLAAVKLGMKKQGTANVEIYVKK